MLGRASPRPQGVSGRSLACRSALAGVPEAGSSHCLEGGVAGGDLAALVPTSVGRVGSEVGRGGKARPGEGEGIGVRSRWRPRAPGWRGKTWQLGQKEARAARGGSAGGRGRALSAPPRPTGTRRDETAARPGCPAGLHPGGHAHCRHPRWQAWIRGGRPLKPRATTPFPWPSASVACACPVSLGLPRIISGPRNPAKGDDPSFSDAHPGTLLPRSRGSL